MHAKFKARKQNGFSIQWNSLKLQQWTQKEKKKRGCQNQNGCKLECFHEKLPAIHVGQQEDAGSKKGVIRIPCNFLACCDLELLGMPGQVARPVALSTVQSMPNDTWPLRLYWPWGLAVFKIHLVGYPFGATFSLGTSFSCCFVCKHFVTSMVRWPASAALTRDFSLFRKPLPLFGRSRTPSPNGYRGNFSEAWSHPGAPEVYTLNGGKGVCGNRTPHNPCLCSQLSQNDNRGTAKIHIQQANKVATSRTPEPVFLDALHGSLPDVPSDPYFIAIFDANKL